MEGKNHCSACANVIIVNYNGRHFLGDCLTSLGAQSFRDFEAWVVDNGSQDGSVRFIQDNFPWVRLISLERNVGFCAGNNLAIRETNGELVVLLNNDTVARADWLGQLVEAALNNPEAGICASRILYLARPHVLFAAGDSYTAWGTAFSRGGGEPADGRFEEAAAVFSACACAALYRRSMLEKIGLFDEDLVFNCEDVDLGFRARLAGYTCLYVPNAVVYHHGSGTAGVANAWVEFMASRNSEYVCFKNMPAVLLLKYLPLHIAQIGWNLLKKSGKGLAVPYLKGKVAFLRSLGGLMRKRAAVQRSRRISAQELLAAMDTAFFSRAVLKLKYVLLQELTRRHDQLPER